MDLVGSAFVIGDLKDADVLSAARYLESRAGDCPAPARQLVSKLLHPEDNDRILEGSQTTEGELRKQIHSHRRRLYEEPRNAILWTDIGFFYTSLGQIEKAKHAMDMACFLSPDNRFVVRSAARFLVHIDDYEKALRLLHNTDRRESDPWIVAAEIGISSLSNVNPRFLKLGRKMVDGRDFTEFAKSELASAMATIELTEGNTRAAKKLFKQSLALPTENSVAQAEWASPRVGDLNIQSNQENVPRNYEAKSAHGYRTGDWEPLNTRNPHKT